MTEQEARKYAAEKGLEFINNHPGNTDEVNGLFSLMKSEIEEGGSPDSEYESFVQSLDDLLIPDND